MEDFFTIVLLLLVPPPTLLLLLLLLPGVGVANVMAPALLEPIEPN